MLELNTMSFHPLHSAVLESFSDLRAEPDPRNAGFSSTMTRVLMEAMISASDPTDAPRFLVDPGMRILRLDIDYQGMNDIADRNTLARRAARFREDILEGSAPDHILCRDHGLVLCRRQSSIADIAHLLDSLDIHLAGFVDPIYEDSFLLVSMSDAAIGRWAGAGAARAA